MDNILAFEFLQLHGKEYFGNTPFFIEYQLIRVGFDGKYRKVWYHKIKKIWINMHINAQKYVHLRYSCDTAV